MWKRQVDLDVADADLKKCSPGDKVILTISGVVKATRLGEKPSSSDGESDSPCCCGISSGYPSSITVEMDKQTVKVGDNQFEALAEQDEES